MIFLKRNIRLENIVLDSKGNCKISNFEICVKMNKKRYDYAFNALDKNENKIDNYSPPELFVTNPEINPEINQTLDFWSLGVIIYKMLVSEFPFYIHCIEYYVEDLQDIWSESKLKNPETFIKKRRNVELDYETKELLSDLSILKKEERLGSKKNDKKIKEYSFFKEIDWQKLENGEMLPPYSPNFNVNMNNN